MDNEKQTTNYAAGAVRDRVRDQPDLDPCPYLCEKWEESVCLDVEGLIGGGERV